MAVACNWAKAAARALPKMQIALHQQMLLLIPAITGVPLQLLDVPLQTLLQIRPVGEEIRLEMHPPVPPATASIRREKCQVA